MPFSLITVSVVGNMLNTDWKQIFNRICLPHCNVLG